MEKRQTKNGHLADKQLTINKQDDTIIELSQEVTYLSKFQDDYYALLEKHNQFVNDVKTYLKDKVNLDCKGIDDVKEGLNGLQVINTEAFDNLEFKDGFIVGYNKTNLLVPELQEVPDDLTHGYWKYVDGKLVIDSVRYQQVWSS